MANINRHTSFGVAVPFEVTDPLDHLFRGFFRPVSSDKAMPPLRMDVKESADSYVVQVDMPGVNKDEIQVSIDGNTVSISAEVKRQSEQKEGENLLRRERHAGRVSRSFALEHELDDAASSARYVDGVLELLLPKKVAAAAKRLTIQ